MDEEQKKDYTLASRGGPGTRPVVIAEVEHHDATEPAEIGVRQHKEAVGVRRIEHRTPTTAAERTAAVADRLRLVHPGLTASEAAHRAASVLSPDPHRRDTTRYADAQRVAEDAQFARLTAGIQREMQRTPGLSAESAALAANAALQREDQRWRQEVASVAERSGREHPSESQGEVLARAVEAAHPAKQRRERADIDCLVRVDRAKAQEQEQEQEGHRH